MLPAPGSEVVDSEDPRDIPGWIRDVHDCAQHRHPAHSGVQDDREPASGPTSEGDGHSFQNPLGGRRSAAIAHGQPSDLLSERTASATGVLAVQPPDGQVDPYRLATHRSIGKVPFVGAVYPSGCCRAVWTHHVEPPGSRLDVNHLVHPEDRFHQHGVEIREQQADQLITPHHGPRQRHVTKAEPLRSSSRNSCLIREPTPLVAQSGERPVSPEVDVCEFWQHRGPCGGSLGVLCGMRARWRPRSPRSICTRRSAAMPGQGCPTGP